MVDGGININIYINNLQTLCLCDQNKQKTVTYM